VEQTVTATGRQRSPGELAQLVSAAAAAGRSTVEDETGHTLPPAKPRRRGRSRALLGLAVAFVLAGALGIGAALLARSSGRPAGLGATPSESPKPNPIPGTTRENINDPAIAPTLTVVESLGGGAVRLRWTDPTKGQAQFIVIRRATPSNEPIPPVLAPGTTEVTLDGLGSGQLCFHLIAVVGEGDNRKTGVSATKCTA
jgi:hypothetical protein